MKTSITLKEERSDIISQLENIKDVATTEERDLTYIATKAVLVREKEGSHLVLLNGLIQMLDIKSQTLSHVGFESLAYELTNLPTTKSRELMNVDTYGIVNLLKADESLLKILKKSGS